MTLQAVEFLVQWVKDQNVPGLHIEVVKLDRRTPTIFMTRMFTTIHRDLLSNTETNLWTPSSSSKKNSVSDPCLLVSLSVLVDGTHPDGKTTLLYGHYDKQPPLTAFWEEGLHPYKPVLRDGTSNSLQSQLSKKLSMIFCPKESSMGEAGRMMGTRSLGLSLQSKVSKRFLLCLCQKMIWFVSQKSIATPKYSTRPPGHSDWRMWRERKPWSSLLHRTPQRAYWNSVSYCMLG